MYPAVIAVNVNVSIIVGFGLLNLLRELQLKYMKIEAAE